MPVSCLSPGCSFQAAQNLPSPPYGPGGTFTPPTTPIAVVAINRPDGFSVVGLPTSTYPNGQNVIKGPTPWPPYEGWPGAEIE